MTIPNVGQMTRAEYERAVELGDSRIAIDDRFTFEFLQDAGLDWSPYVDRLLEVVDGWTTENRSKSSRHSSATGYT